MAADLVAVAKQRKIKYFLISYVDLFGGLRAKLVPARAIGEMQRAGAGFAGFATWLDMTPADSDMFAVPDADSLTILPWKPEVGWLAADLMMDGKPVCVLRGHGVTTAGATIEQAVARALALDSLARMATAVVALGGTVRALPDDDLTQLPDLGAAFNDELLWRHQEARLAAAGLALDSPAGVGERRADEGRVDEGGVDE